MICWNAICTSCNSCSLISFETQKYYGKFDWWNCRNTRDVDYCAEHNIISDVEINMDYINEAYERMNKSDVKYRFVIDMASLKK
jgi:hypothetical protein